MDVPTPNIDKIMNEGIVFPRSYAGGPKCAPSRFSVLTGKYPSRSYYARKQTTDGTVGTDVTVPNVKMVKEDNQQNLVQFLRNSSNIPYYTGMTGKWHLMTNNDNGYGYGCNALTTTQNAELYENCTEIVKKTGFHFADAIYHSNIGSNDFFGHNPEWMVHESQRFINESIKRDDPFFLYFSPTLTHTPDFFKSLFNYSLSATPKGNLTGDDIPINTGMMSRKQVWKTALNCSYKAFSKIEEAAGIIWLDSAIGAVIDFVEDSGLLDETFIVITNDHGMGAKGTLYETGNRIFQYIRYPKLFGTDGHILPQDFIVSNTDLAAVITELAQIDVENKYPDYKMDGISWISDVLTYIQDVNNTIDYTLNPPSCCQLRYADIYNSHAIYTKDYEYIFRASDTIEDDYPISWYYSQPFEQEQLYDYNLDPNQQMNILNTSYNISNSYLNITFDLQYLMIQHIYTHACQSDDIYYCVIPNITYIPSYSNYSRPIPPAPAPTPVGWTCVNNVSWSFTWTQVANFDETKPTPVATRLADAEDELLIDHPECAEISTLEYVYDFTKSGKRLTVDLIACCPGGSTFGSWPTPTNFAENSVMSPRIWDDIEEHSAIGLKEIIAINVALMLAICCCFIGYLWYNKKKNEKQMKQITEMMQQEKKKKNNNKYEQNVPSASNSRRPSIITCVELGKNSDKHHRESVVTKKYEHGSLSSSRRTSISSNQQQHGHNTNIPPAIAMAMSGHNYNQVRENSRSNSSTPLHSHMTPISVYNGQQVQYVQATPISVNNNNNSTNSSRRGSTASLNGIPIMKMSGYNTNGTKSKSQDSIHDIVHRSRPPCSNSTNASRRNSLSDLSVDHNHIQQYQHQHQHQHHNNRHPEVDVRSPIQEEDDVIDYANVNQHYHCDQ